MSSAGNWPLRLAGDIAAQFPQLSTDAAAERVAHHIRMFWDPRMRRKLRDEVAAEGSAVSPVIARVVTLLND